MENKSARELSPVAMYTAIAVAVVAVAAIGYMVFGRSGYRAQTAPTADITQSAPAAGYRPPSGAPVQLGAPGFGGSGGMPPMSGPPGGIPGGQPPGR